jgi:ankyrin repeat protein
MIGGDADDDDDEEQEEQEEGEYFGTRRYCQSLTPSMAKLQLRKQQLTAFYQSQDPSNQQVIATVDALLTQYKFEDVAASLMQTYNALPEGWAAEIEQQTPPLIKIGIRAMVPYGQRWAEAYAMLATIDDEIKSAMFPLYSHMLNADMMYDAAGAPWPRDYLSLQALKKDPESSRVDDSQWVFSDNLFNDLNDQQLVKQVEFSDPKAQQARDAALCTAACISEYCFVNLQANCQCCAMERIVASKDKPALLELLAMDRNAMLICYSNHGPKDGFCLLHMSVVGQWLEGTQVLLQSVGQGIDARCGRNSGSALHLAVVAGDGEESQAIVTALVGSGADKNMRDMDTTEYTSGDWITSDSGEALEAVGATPLLLAMKEEHVAVARLLVLTGVDVNLADKDNLTPLHWAVTEIEDLELARLLLQRGAIVNLDNKDIGRGNTLLHWSCSRGKTNAVKLLLEFGADVNQPGKDAYHPLHLAAKMGKIPLLKLLLEAGADAKAKDRQGQTPAEIARQNNRQAAVDLLQ